MEPSDAVNDSMVKNSTAILFGDEFGNATNFSAYDTYSDYPNEDYIFDRTDVRIIFITLYTIVFCCCFFGKSNKKN